ncbi:betaine/proline/choline family ABC transporter ATP-binding protein [Paenibacillus sp. N1-5-1-14]|uniref:ABC transporter ATP-binding protein n=1 Tax=Paenibacillus radicibacter TaxID=2972488 RepID=UPI0021590698|nr:betaine/proline/choline family ABC transporter ATP-binding protein [Paenibacillus radicibacter]MCR8642478.1 betaine/proline/choline family ABC transporter ATP-binding protein [Paenibacillus radicibacter]
MIRFEKVSKRYDNGYVAIESLDLEFAKGLIHVLIGPSGCGKTTTMRMINRLNVPSSGKIYINNKDISQIDPVELRRSIGYVIQSIGLFPHMTIARNVAVVPRLLKWDQARIDKRVDELLELVNLSPDTYRSRYPSELSGGQQQRVGVIRAFAAEPDIIVMDEPFSALDPISRENLQDELIRLQQELNTTIIFVTHDMDEAIKLADNMILMKDGFVVQQGRPEHILRHPANDFVKSFVGKQRLMEDSLSEKITVDEVMAEYPVTAYPSRGLAEAIKIMERRRVDSLIIVDRKHVLLGHVSIFQVIERFKEENITIGDLATPFEHVVEQGSDLQSALQLLTNQRLPFIPVVADHNRFVGLITKGSVVRYIADVYGAESEPSPVEGGASE